MTDEEYLTVSQVSEMLQVHPESVTRWIRHGELPGYLLSRRAGYRIRSSDLQHFVRSKRSSHAVQEESEEYDEGSNPSGTNR